MKRRYKYLLGTTFPPSEYIRINNLEKKVKG
jgi:hypothetical protein